MENALKSGEFLLKQVTPESVFIPEEFDEEQRMIAQTCQDFIEAEVYPNLEQLEKGDRKLMEEILKKSGELGLMGIAIPEEFGGFGQSFVTQMLAAETTGAGFSFSVAYMAHCGIGTMPIMYFGNEDQRSRYIPRLATGELIGAYCLTEPGAGSDANSGKSSATLDEDGRNYILNGQKMWITNAGFADIQIVFAKIDNDRVLSAFIVEKDYPGVVIGPDEHKMGIKGSSTAQIYYNDVKVPVENLLGKRGEGFRIALSILHMGRIKLGANVIGAAKKAINDSVQYATERKQFNTAIASFGAIKSKLAMQVVKSVATESAIYRVSRDIDNLAGRYVAENCEKGRASIDAISYYAVEAALLKVYGSEMLDFVVDEAVQIHGGMGYSAEMAVEKAYRDSRINRIFEGTNEINRLLLVDTAMKRAMKGDFDLFGEAEKVFADPAGAPAAATSGESYGEEMLRYTGNFKKCALMAIHAASSTFGKKLVHEQEILTEISDIMTSAYLAESLVLRTLKREMTQGEDAVFRAITNIFIFNTASEIRRSALGAIFSTLSPDEAEPVADAIEKLTSVRGVNLKEEGRLIADKLIEDGSYKF